MPRLKRRAQTIADAQSAVVGAAPNRYQGILASAFAKSASPLRAIQANCLTCTHYQRTEISHCKVYACPLWKYRPYQAKR